MDLNYLTKWASFYLFALVSLFYFYNAFKYAGFISNTKNTNSTKEVKLQKINALMHFLTASQMFLGLYHVIKLNPPIAAAHVGFSGFSILALSTTKLMLLDKNTHKASLEILLTVFGFIFLSFHILSRVL